MCYNIGIMKKYCLFIAASAILLCGCETSKPSEYVYLDHTPLTVVTTSAVTTPADTYSEYMETYTSPVTTGTDVYYYYLPPTHDGGIGSAAQMDIPSMDKPQLDTAARPEKAERPDISAYTTEVATTTVPEESTEETESVSEVFSINVPEADAIHIQTVPADTAPTEYVPETSLPTE